MALCIIWKPQVCSCHIICYLSITLKGPLHPSPHTTVLRLMPEPLNIWQINSYLMEQQACFYFGIPNSRPWFIILFLQKPKLSWQQFVSFVGFWVTILTGLCFDIEAKISDTHKNITNQLYNVCCSTTFLLKKLNVESWAALNTVCYLKMTTDLYRGVLLLSYPYAFIKPYKCICSYHM